MMNDALTPVVPETETCERLFDQVANPLMDLRDTSLQALDEGNTTPGDLQSQFLLAYHGWATTAGVYSKSIGSKNRLGLNKVLQAFMPLPAFFGAMCALELPTIFMGVHPTATSYFLILFACLFGITAFACLLMLANVKALRGGSWSRNLLEPDHIAISPQGINLQWSGKILTHLGLVLPWKRIALVYIEEHATGDQKYEVLCIRDNLGKALRLDCRAFASDVLIKALHKKAPWAVKEPPMVLALQPAQRARWFYLISWTDSLKRSYGISKPGSAELISLSTRKEHIACESGTQLKKGKYKILSVRDPEPNDQGFSYLAEVSGASSDSDAVAYRGVRGFDQVANTATSVVRIERLVLPAAQNADEMYSVLDAFEREVRRLSRVNSNNICRWLDVFVEDTSIFLVTEYDAGKTLRQCVEETGPYSEMKVRELAMEMCEILSHLHHLDPPYVHKMFTPDSLIVSSNQFVKLSRFAIGLQLLPSTLSCPGLDRRYMPLEQLRNYETNQSDIYAFGATLFFLLTGKDPEPFRASSARAVRPEISTHFDAIIGRATSPSPSDRYESIDQIKTEILELANAETSLVLL